MTHYNRLNLQRALGHPYSPEQVARIAQAIGVAQNDARVMAQHFDTRGSATYLTRQGVEALAARQDQWRAGRLYQGAIDGIWGGLSDTAHTRSMGALGPAEPSVLAEVVPTRTGTLGPAEPTIAGERVASVGSLGPAEPSVINPGRRWTPV